MFVCFLIKFMSIYIVMPMCRKLHLYVLIRDLQTFVVAKSTLGAEIICIRKVISADLHANKCLFFNMPTSFLIFSRMCSIFYVIRHLYIILYNMTFLFNLFYSTALFVRLDLKFIHRTILYIYSGNNIILQQKDYENGCQATMYVTK